MTDPGHVALRILDIVSVHGYALRELVRGSRFFYPMSNSNIYPVLHELEGEGFVTCEQRTVEGRLRKLYTRLG